jgi:hypothetical protein
MYECIAVIPEYRYVCDKNSLTVEGYVVDSPSAAEICRGVTVLCDRCATEAENKLCYAFTVAHPTYRNTLPTSDEPPGAGGQAGGAGASGAAGAGG